MASSRLSPAPSPQSSTATPGLYQTLVPLIGPDPDPPPMDWCHSLTLAQDGPYGAGAAPVPPTALFLAGEVGEALSARTCPVASPWDPSISPSPQPRGSCWLLFHLSLDSLVQMVRLTLMPYTPSHPCVHNVAVDLHCLDLLYHL